MSRAESDSASVVDRVSALDAWWAEKKTQARSIDAEPILALTSSARSDAAAAVSGFRESAAANCNDRVLRDDVDDKLRMLVRQTALEPQTPGSMRWGRLWANFL